MFDNLSNTSVGVTSEEDLLAALGEQPQAKKGAGKKSDKTDKTDKKEDKKEKPGKEKSNPKLSEKEFKEVLGGDDDDDDNTDDNEDDNDTGKNKGKKKVVAKKKEENNDDDDNDDDDEDQSDDNQDDNDDSNDDDDDKKDDNDDTNDDDDNEDSSISVKDFIKARVEFLIKKGEWKDFDDRDKVEWDEETFADMELQQREAQRQDLKDELLDSFGPYGSKIAEYTANGGDPDKLIDIFKEQQKIGNLSLETEDGQKDVVFKHQTKFLGKSAESANRYIKSLIADNALEAEAKESKDLMEKDLKQQEEDLQESQEELIKQQKLTQQRNLKKFGDDVKDLIGKRDDIPADEKKELIKVLTVFNKTLPNGTPVNEFYSKFAEFRKDLPNYLEFVRLVLNPEKYKKSVKNKGKSEQAEKDFKLLRTSNLKKKTASSSVDEGEKGKNKKTTFKLLY